MQKNNSKESVKTKWFTNVLRTVEAPERLHHQIDERRKKRKRDHGGLTLSDIPAFKAMVQDDSIDNILRDVTENVRTSFEQIVKKRKKFCGVIFKEVGKVILLEVVSLRIV